MRIDRLNLDDAREAARDMNHAITEWFRVRDNPMVTTDARHSVRISLENAIADMAIVLEPYLGP